MGRCDKQQTINVATVANDCKFLWIEIYSFVKLTDNIELWR